MAKLTLRFADGDAAEVAVRADETLLSAARRAGVSLASDCEVGDCQTCRARLASGEAVYDEYATISLTQDEINAGEILTCVAMAEDDISVQLPYERAHLLSAKPFTLKVVGATRLCDSVMRLSALGTGRSPLAFLPGQYVNLKVPGTDQSRSFSMANAPDVTGNSFEFLVRLLDGGAMSQYLMNRLAPGDVINANGPFGTFYLRASARPILMVAGGTGIAPMASMLRAMIARQDQRPVILCFGVSTPADLFYLDELEPLAKQFASLEMRVAIMKGNVGPHVSGVVTDLVNRGDVADRDIYLCGPPAMTDRAKTMLSDHGADQSCTFVERFVPVAAVSEFSSV